MKSLYAEALYNRGKFVRATQICDECIEQAPDFLYTYIVKAIGMQKLDCNHPEFNSLISKCTKADPYCFGWYSPLLGSSLTTLSNITQKMQDIMNTSFFLEEATAFLCINILFDQSMKIVRQIPQLYG